MVATDRIASFAAFRFTAGVASKPTGELIMLTRLRMEPKATPFLQYEFIITGQKEAAVAEILFGLHPTLLQTLVAEAVVRRIQSDPELMEKFLAAGTENGEFVLGPPRNTPAGLSFPFKFFLATPNPVSKSEAVRRLRAANHGSEADALARWTNANGNDWGWDGWVRVTYPEFVRLIWPPGGT
jgi:hypothetical protein